MPKEIIPFVLSDHKKNSYGFVLLTLGIELDDFNNNPVMLLNHNENLVLGKWNNTRVESDRLIADPEFDMDDEEAAKISGKVDRGYMRGTSVGIMIKEVNLNYPNYEGVPVVTKSQLLEASITPIPANTNALRLYNTNKELLNDEQVKTLLSHTTNNNPPNPNPMKKLTFMAVALSLADTATEDEVLQSITQMANTNKDLQTQLSTAQTALSVANEAKINALVDGAIASNKLTAAQKDIYVKLAKGDYETTKAVIDGMKAHQSLSSQMNTGASTNKYADWDFKRFHRENPKELQRIKIEEPIRYQELWDAEYQK